MTDMLGVPTTGTQGNGMLPGQRNPEYVLHEQDWELCRDCYAGQRAIKIKGSRYLPVVSSMVLDGWPTVNSKGWVDYECYKRRASFHNYFKKSVLHYMGQLWHKEPTIELPARMEPLRDNCTRQNESLMQLLRNMHEEILITGRLGLYGEFPKGETTENVLPYISMYKAESIINWDEGEKDQVNKDSLNMVVLNESSPRRIDLFNWDQRLYQFRVLLLGDPYVNEESSDTESASLPEFSAGLFVGLDSFSLEGMSVPKYRGLPLNRIPFVFVNSKHVQAQVDEPPQLDLANQDLTIYLAEADYRMALHMQAAPTLVRIGVEQQLPGAEPVRTGIGAMIDIANPAGDVKYVGIDPTGLPEMRASLENDVRIAEVMSGTLTDKSMQKESADAMGKRMAGESCRLINIATTAAMGLQQILRILAEWLGENPESVLVSPNIDFTNEVLSPADLLALQQFKTAGGPLSDESMHMNVARSGLTDKTYEDEQTAIDGETPRIDLSGAPLGAPLNPLQDQQKKHADVRLQMDQQAAKDQKAADAKAAKKPGAKK